MEASIDTDIIIHLYKSGKKELLYSFCDKLYIHEYLLEKELKYKDIGVYNEFKRDIILGNIEVITDEILSKIGLKYLFDEFKYSNDVLFDSGELRAVALARVMGIASFLSDDTKEFGPHETLVKEIIEGVIPFAFYELLFLKFLNNELTLEEFYADFISITSSSMTNYPMKFRSRILRTVRRFSSRYGTDRDKKWIINFCIRNNINYKVKMKELKLFLETC